jgi:hypothetical protein
MSAFPADSELAAEFEPAQLVELVVLAGFYRTISCIARAFAIDHEEGAPRFPVRKR